MALSAGFVHLPRVQSAEQATGDRVEIKLNSVPVEIELVEEPDAKRLKRIADAEVVLKGEVNDDREAAVRELRFMNDIRVPFRFSSNITIKLAPDASFGLLSYQTSSRSGNSCSHALKTTTPFEVSSRGRGFPDQHPHHRQVAQTEAAGTPLQARLRPVTRPTALSSIGSAENHRLK